MTSYDVVVVGGRLAGAATAMLLARAGLTVAVVERGTRGSDTVSTHALMRAGVLQLSRWGLLDRVRAAGTPAVTRTVFCYPHEERVQVTIRPSAGVPALFAPRRWLLDRLMVEAAEDAGAHFWHETVVTGLRRGSGGRVTGVVARARSGAAVELAAGMTVGADGIRSAVAAEVAAPIVRQGRSASAVLYGYVDGQPPDAYQWFYGRGSAAGVIPTNDGEACVFVSTTPTRMRALRRHGGRSAFDTLLEETAPAVAAQLRSGQLRPDQERARLHGWAGVPGIVRTSWGEGWALVGDAGYFKDPITTHGMTDALRDADLLSTAVIEVMVDGVPEVLALPRYQRRRDELSERLLTTTEAVARYDWDTARVKTLLRQVSSAMSDEVDHLEALPDGSGADPVPRGARAIA
jgi:2-polyprenyl-6-methoxyphenol hydroxylase-like FAD-dependent oxidoreductase